MNGLQEEIENKVITRTFIASGMPESVYYDVDNYCKEHFGDNRWTMISTLVKNAKDDYKYALLYDEIMSVKEELASLRANVAGQDNQSPKRRTFV